MKILNHEVLIKKGTYFDSSEFNEIKNEIYNAIGNVVWPEGSNGFTVNPVRKGNGVKPIKNACMNHLQQRGWMLEERLRISSERPGPLDAVKEIEGKGIFALEWETGNISSSHRALNKMVLGIQTKSLIGGVLILPSRNFYKFLTDRIGNYQELSPYFPVWRNINIEYGFLSIIEIEHDFEDSSSPLIPKGTDGWAEYQ